MRVYCYRNLTKNCWSVKALEGPDKGRVIKHATTVLLSDAVPRVSEAGRQRVLKAQQKNVHAGIVGHLSFAGSTPLVQHGAQVTYDPYRYTTFVYVDDTSRPYTGSAWALLQDGKVHVKG